MRQHTGPLDEGVPPSPCKETHDDYGIGRFPSRTVFRVIAMFGGRYGSPAIGTDVAHDDSKRFAARTATMNIGNKSMMRSDDPAQS